MDGPLFADHFRVVGVDDCLKLRAEPHPDAKVINCLPERTVVRQARTFDPHTDGRHTWRVDGTLWRLLTNPFDLYANTNTRRPIGWADGRYLEDVETMPTTPYHDTAIDPHRSSTGSGSRMPETTFVWQVWTSASMYWRGTEHSTDQSMWSRSRSNPYA